MKLKLYILVLTVLTLTGCSGTAAHEPPDADAAVKATNVGTAEIPGWNIRGYIVDTNSDFRKSGS